MRPQIWEHILKTRDTSLLTHFLVITFADLKKYRYYYWFAFPAFMSKPAWEIAADGWKDAKDELSAEAVSQLMAFLALKTNSWEQLSSIHDQLRSHSNPLPFFLVKNSSKETSISPVESYLEFFASTPASSVRFTHIHSLSDPVLTTYRSGLLPLWTPQPTLRTQVGPSETFLHTYRHYTRTPRLQSASCAGVTLKSPPRHHGKVVLPSWSSMEVPQLRILVHSAQVLSGGRRTHRESLVLE